MKFISGKKMSMTQIWSGDKVFGVTPVQAGPCVVTQVKTKAKDGYNALQLAYGTRQAKNINKPQLGHFKSLNILPAHVREFRTEEAANFKAGDVITVKTFKVGDIVNVTSKGRVFKVWLSAIISMVLEKHMVTRTKKEWAVPLVRKVRLMFLKERGWAVVWVAIGSRRLI